MALLETGTLRQDEAAQAEAASLLRQSLALYTVLLAECPQGDPLHARTELSLEQIRQALSWYHQLQIQESADHVRPPTPGGTTPLDDRGFAELVAGRLLDEARHFEALHPDEIHAIRDRYLVVAREHADTTAAGAAEEALARLEDPASAPSRVPHWQRLEERLRELEPGTSAQVRDDVRQLLRQRRFLEAFDLVRRAHAAARQPRTRAALTALLSDLRHALETISFALLGGVELVDRTHVFRLASGHTMAGQVEEFDGTTFTVRQADGSGFPVPLFSLSAQGLVQVATSGATSSEPFLAAGYLFLLLRDFPDAERYLELARKRGGDTTGLETTACLTREIDELRRATPAARAAWQRVRQALEHFHILMRRRAYRPALVRLKRVLGDVNDEDIPAFDELCHERMGVGLAALLAEARTSCTAVHVDVEQNLVTCPTCEGDGIVTRPRDPDRPDQVSPRAFRCPDCDGTGTVQCPRCADRFLDPELRAFHERVARLTGH
jgi:hypothetical protein